MLTPNRLRGEGGRDAAGGLCPLLARASGYRPPVRDASRLNSAKLSLSTLGSKEAWWRGIGIGLVGKTPGLIVSVRTDALAEARAFVKAAAPGVPVEVRGLGEVRARSRPAAGKRRLDAS